MLDYIHGSKKRLAAAVGAALLAGAFSIVPRAEANPVLDAKDAAVSISGLNTANMTVTSGAENNLIKWVDFSIGQNESVTFDAKNYLNYVTGSARSDILGTLTGGGSIYIVNPNGILIGDGATVNVGSLHLSTKALAATDLTDYATAADALASASIGIGDVINMGKLNATSISVEGKNITFKNIADVTKNTLNAAGEITGTTQNTAVSLTANGGEIHIGSAGGTASGYTVSGATEIDYKLISTPDELQAINTDQTTLGGNYMLAGHINMSGVSGFTPIGVDGVFRGRFDGLNYQIQNLAIESDRLSVGLFGVNKGVIENVGLVGGSVTGTTNGRVGGIVGLNDEDGTVRNVYNTGSVTGRGTDSTFAKTGGIVGNNAGTVERAYNTGAVTGASGGGTGGIVGYNTDTVSQVYNAGTVSAPDKDYAGGIAGRADLNSSIRDAYNTGAVSGGSRIGGIVGCVGTLNGVTAATITNVYNSGTVNDSTVTEIRGSSSPYVGGIVGQVPNNAMSPTNAYTSNLTDAGTFTGFDFSENGVWRIYDGKTTPLLTAFMTRKDNITSQTTYDGNNTVGATYATQSVEIAESITQVGGINYVKDVSIVTPKDLTVNFTAISKTYDGTTDATAGTATLTGKVGTDDVSLAAGVTAAYADKNAGENKTVNYTGIALSGEKAKNYNLTSTTYDNTTSTINKANITVSVADITKTYDGTTKTDNTTDAAGGALKVTSGKLYDGDTMSGGTKTYADVNAGKGNKTVEVSGVTINDGNNGDNYNVTYADNTTSTINQRPLTVEFKTVSKIYDGKTTVELPTTTQYYTLNGKLDSDVIDLATDKLSAEFADKNAGENKTVYYKGVALTGVPAGNYALKSTTATGLGSIHKAGVHITAFADTTKVYDGTTDAPLGAATFDGLIDADEGKVGVKGTAVYDGKDVGDHTVSYSGLALTGAEARNYQLDTFSLAGFGTISRRPLWLVATPQTITEGEATPTTWSGNLTGFVAGEGLGANDVYFFALDNPAASSVGKYSITGTLKIGDNEPATSGDYGDNYTFANAASNATAFTISAKPAPEPTPTPTPTPEPTPTPQPEPKPQNIVEKVTGNPGAAKEYTDVIASQESGANTVLPTANLLPTESATPTNSVLPTGNNQPTGSAQPTEKAQENNSVSGEQNETQEQNGSLPAQPTAGGQPAAGRQETQLGVTYTDINMPKSMSIEALAAALNGEKTQQSGAPAASNTAPTESTAMSGTPQGAEPVANGTVEDNEEA